MLKVLGVNNAVLIILLIILGSISGKYIKMIKKNIKIIV